MTIKIKSASKLGLVWVTDPINKKRRKLYEYNGDFYRLVRESWAFDALSKKKIKEAELELVVKGKKSRVPGVEETRKVREEAEPTQKRKITIRKTSGKGTDLTPTFGDF